MQWKALARSEALPKYRSSREEELRDLFFIERYKTGLPEWAQNLLSQNQNVIRIRQGANTKTVKLIDHGITYENAKGSSIQAAIAKLGGRSFIVVNNGDGKDEDINPQPLTGDSNDSNDSLFVVLLKKLTGASYHPPTAWRFEEAIPAYPAEPATPTVDNYLWGPD